MHPKHIVPASRGPWALQRALEETKQPGEVLVFPDDLTFGPISGDVTKTRASLRTDFRGKATKNEDIATFWSRLEQDNETVTIWFGRHSADELAMLLVLCERLGDRSISVVDATNLSIHASWNGASPAIPPPRGIQDVPGSVFRLLESKAVPLEPALRNAYAARWRLLQAENASLRMIGADGLQSASPEEFDSCLLAALSNDWRRTISVILAAERFAGRQYRQTGRSGLLTRAAALVEKGTLEAKGNVWDLWDDEDCAVRLPDNCPTPARKAEVCHVASHSSFAGNLVGCLQRASRNDDVLGCPDELSAGPIASDDVQIRAAWWDGIAGWPDHDTLSAFWRDVAAAPPLIVWSNRLDASDQCLYLALCDKMPDRIAAIGDVSTISVRYEWIDGTAVDLPSPQTINEVPEDVLSAMTAFTVRPGPAEIAANAQRWRDLKAENAPFRVINEGALISQPSTYFDNFILAAAATDWQKTIRVIGGALHDCWANSHRLSEYALLSRVVSLVESGVLEAEGDPCQMLESRIRRARKG